MMAETQTSRQAKYDAANTKQFKLKLNLKTDADILEKLDSVENRQGYIKQLIRADMEENMNLTLHEALIANNYTEREADEEEKRGAILWDSFDEWADEWQPEDRTEMYEKYIEAISRLKKDNPEEVKCEYIGSEFVAVYDGRHGKTYFLTEVN